MLPNRGNINSYYIYSVCARARVGVCVYQDLISLACVAAYFPFSGVGHKVLRPWASES